MKRFIPFFPLTAFLLTAALFQARAQDAVINKFRYGGGRDNGASDTVEILVLKRGLDMRGMVLKDFAPASAIGDYDNAGWFRFSPLAPVWQNVSAGTLIVVSFKGASADADPSDCLLRVNARDNAYFVQYKPDYFGLARNDLLMLKAAGSQGGGFEGSVHAFASGKTSWASFDEIPGKKLRSADEPSAATPFVVAPNPTASLADFDGGGRELVAVVSAATFGRGNTPQNQRFIDSLRYASRALSATSVFDATDASEALPLSVFPNPAREAPTVAFALERAERVEFWAADMLGGRVFLGSESASAGEFRRAADVSALPAGAYWLEARSASGVWRGKFVKGR